MTKLRKFYHFSLGVLALLLVICCIPVEYKLNAPKSAVLVGGPDDCKHRMKVYWHCSSWRANGLTNRYVFGPGQDLEFRPLVIPITVGKLVFSHIYTKLVEGACDCQKPGAYFEIALDPKMPPPDHGSWGVAVRRVGDVLHCEIEKVPDEKAIPPRAFKPADPAGLVDEVRVCLAGRRQGFVKEDSWGPQIRALNPVRVQCERYYMIVLMGGEDAFVIIPDVVSFPGGLQAHLSPTAYAKIHRLDPGHDLAIEPQKSAFYSFSQPW